VIGRKRKNIIATMSSASMMIMESVSPFRENDAMATVGEYVGMITLEKRHFTDERRLADRRQST
jgi:hypothetical protein